jgi:hypothetical protein
VVRVVLWGDLVSVLFTVTQWTRYMHLLWCSRQKGSIGGKCFFVVKLNFCTVHCSTVDVVRACSLL